MASFFLPLPQLCIKQTHKIQFRTSAKWNLMKGCLAIILECVFVLLLKEHHRQEKHLFRNLKALTEHLLSLLLCLFTGEWVFCNDAEQVGSRAGSGWVYSQRLLPWWGHWRDPPLAKQPRKH